MKSCQYWGGPWDGVRVQSAMLPPNPTHPITVQHSKDGKYYWCKSCRTYEWKANDIGEHI